MNARAAYIARLARAYGVDPAAALSIASVEGGFNGAVGDHGTSFGPFQLHEGGALPSGLRNPDQWANSKAGIQYAMQRIAQVARGLHGKQAIAAISSRFERPANVAGEVANASARYGQFSGGKLPAGGGPLGAPQAQQLGGGSAGGANPAQMAAAQLLAQSLSLAQGGQQAPSPLTDSSNLLTMAMMRDAMQNAPAAAPAAGGAVRGSAPSKGGFTSSGHYSNIVTDHGVNITHVDPKLLTAINDVARAHGVKVTINSGYRTPQHSVAVGGFANDPHTRGIAVDAYVNGRPIGQVFGPAIWRRYGVISGNVPNFYNGAPDPEHLQIG